MKMLNLFKSKPGKVESSQQDIQNDQFKAEIESVKVDVEQINTALKMYDDTMINHWGAIARLQGMDSRLESPNTKKIKEIELDFDRLQRNVDNLNLTVKTPPSTAQVRKLFADMADVVVRVSNLEGKKDKTSPDTDKKFNELFDVYKDYVNNHAMHINALMEQVSNLTNEVELLKAPEKAKQPSAPIKKTADQREEQLRKKREYNKAYYSNEEKREAHKRYMKQWNAKRKEKRQAEKYTDQLKLKKQAYYLANKEKILARLAAAREAKRLKAMK